jgi:hypothetical protein
MSAARHKVGAIAEKLVAAAKTMCIADKYTLCVAIEKELLDDKSRPILSEGIDTAAERIKALAYVLRMGSDLQASDMNPVFDMISELADEIAEQSAHARTATTKGGR